MKVLLGKDPIKTIRNNLLNTGTAMLTEISIGGCRHMFESWTKVMQENRFTRNQDKIGHIESMMNMGLRLSKLTKKANSCLSPFLLNDMLIFLVSVVTWGYMACCILFPRNMEQLQISWIPLAQAILWLCLSGENLWRIWCLCNIVQDFLNARGKALKELQDDIMENYPLLDRRLKWRAQIAEEGLSNEDAFSPHDFFNLGRSAFLPTLASGFTYFIIIVQFKLSEVSVEPNYDNGTNSTTQIEILTS